MEKEDIIKLINQTIDDKLMSYNNFTIPQHKHNGVDSPRFTASNLLPYKSFAYVPTTGVTAPAVEGTIQLYDLVNNNPPYYNFGISTYQNEEWNNIELADYYCIIPGVAGQTIPTGTTATIKFIAPTMDIKPILNYDSTTGIFTLPNINQGKFFITASVEFEAGTLGGMIIAIVQGGNTVVSSGFVLSDLDLDSMIITYLGDASFADTLEIQVTNNTGADRVVSDGFLAIKKYI